MEVQQVIEMETATTNAAVDMLTIEHKTTGNPSAGFGVGVVFQALADQVGNLDVETESSTARLRDMARVIFEWDTAIDAGRWSCAKVYLGYYGGLVEAFRVYPDGQIIASGNVYELVEKGNV